MGMSLTVGDLRSRAARITSAGGTAIRTFRPNSHGLKQDQDGGILGSIINAGLRFVGWVLGKLWSFISSFVSWSLSAIWGYFCRAVGFFWRFQWNQSDEQMNASLQSAWNAFGGTLGAAVGNTLGNLIVIGGSSVLFAFNEPMAVYVLRELGEEALQELTQQAANVVQAIIPLATTWLFNMAFQKARTAIGANPDASFESDNDIANRLADDVIAGRITNAQRVELIRKNQESRNAAKAERKPFSFANEWENYVEEVQKDHPFWGNFLENLFEETIDAIQDMGYVAFGAVDSYVAQHKIGTGVATGDSGQPITVELTLDRSLDDDDTP